MLIMLLSLIAGIIIRRIFDKFVISKKEIAKKLEKCRNKGEQIQPEFYDDEIQEVINSLK